MDNKRRIHNAAQAIASFQETLNRIAGALKSKVEVLQQQAAAPVAHEPEDLDAEFEELDAALGSLSGVGTTLSTISGPTTGSTAPLSAGSPPSQTTARGTGPEGNPGVPNAGAPGGGFTPTGSHDDGPGGSKPIGGVTGVPVTTEGGEPAPTPQTNIVSPGQAETMQRERWPSTPAPSTGEATSPPVDATITSPGQPVPGGTPPELGQPEGVVPAGPLLPTPPEQSVPAVAPSGAGGAEEGGIAGQFTGEQFTTPPAPDDTSL